MDLSYSEDQIALGDLVRDICNDYCSTDVVRSCEDDVTGYSAPLWEQLKTAGLLGTLIDEEFGGNKISMLENAAIYEQFGRSLASIPHFVSSVVSTLLLTRSGNSDMQSRLLPGIASGETLVSPAGLEPDCGYEVEGVNTTANYEGGKYRLNGTKRHVFFAAGMDYFLVLARTGEGNSAINIFLVPRDAKGVSLSQELSMASDCQYRVELTDVEVQESDCLNQEGDGWSLWNTVINEAIILDAARAVGLAERALEITVAYAMEREQFDKPIGAFQAIGHYLADSATEVEGAKTLMYEAAWAHSEGKPYETLASMAKLFACNTAREVTAKAQQIHGGIGFTMEYDIQLFFRRAKQQQLNWWDTRSLESKIATAVLDSDEPVAVSDPFVL